MRRLAAFLTGATLLLGACTVQDFPGVGQNDDGIPATQVDLDRSGTPAPHSELSEIVERALPSVVHVKVTALDFEGGTGPGEGSGVVIDASGVILTNNHVIAGAVEVNVAFTDGRDPLKGQVIGADPERDLAIIKVDADDLTAIPIGRSGDMKLGDDVVAIGFPLGLGGATVTKGILSGTERAIEAQASFGIERLKGLLQTDAAINPGNSGGALIDMNGALIGINTAVAGSAENIGFAIAIDEAIPVVESFLEDPREPEPWLGVQLATMDELIAAELGYSQVIPGALIVSVIPASPAEEAGLPRGGVVVAIDGTDVDSREELVDELDERDPGDRVTLEIVTPSGTDRVTVELTQRPFEFIEPEED